MTKKSPSLRVLVVDDESLVRWSLSEVLVDSGHAVVEAGDGTGAIRNLEQSAQPFDVILLDYRLPDSSDLRLLSAIRRLAPHSAVIMMTAFGAPDVTKGALDLGAYRVVPKPFEMHEIVALVAEAYTARPWSHTQP